MSAEDTQLESESDRWERRAKHCGWGVVAGLVLEVILTAVFPAHDPKEADWRLALIETWGPVFADILVAAGVWGEIICSGKVRKVESELRRRSNKRVEDALDRATKAETELAQFRAPRTLTNEQASRVAAEITKFAGMRFSMAGSDFGHEIACFATSIAECLLNAKWKPESYPFSIEGASVEKRMLTLPSVPILFGGIAVTDVLVSYSSENEGTKAASQALADALIAEGFKVSVAGTIPGCQQVLVLVGPKT